MVSTPRSRKLVQDAPAGPVEHPIPLLTGWFYETYRLVEVRNVDATVAVDGKRQGVIHRRIRGRPAVSGIAGNSVPCNRGNDPVEIDLANPLGEEVAEEEVARI